MLWGSPHLTVGWTLTIGAFVASIVIGFVVMVIASSSKIISNPDFGLDEDDDHPVTDRHAPTMMEEQGGSAAHERTSWASSEDSPSPP